MPVEAKQSWYRVKWVVVKVEVDKVRLDHYQSESKFVNVMEQTMGWLVGEGRGCKRSKNPIPTIYTYTLFHIHSIFGGRYTISRSGQVVPGHEKMRCPQKRGCNPKIEFPYKPPEEFVIFRELIGG
jgi:hypothetical protein